MNDLSANAQDVTAQNQRTRSQTVGISLDDLGGPDSSNRANSPSTSMAHVRVPMQLPLVVVNPRLGHRADSIACLALSGRVIGRENRGGSSYDRADLIVHLLALGLVDELARQDGAGIRIVVVVLGGESGVGNLRVLVKVVVVVRCSTDDRAGLAWLVQIDVWVRRGQSGVGGSNNGAVHCG